MKPNEAASLKTYHDNILKIIILLLDAYLCGFTGSVIYDYELKNYMVWTQSTGGEIRVGHTCQNSKFMWVIWHADWKLN